MYLLLCHLPPIALPLPLYYFASTTCQMSVAAHCIPVWRHDRLATVDLLHFAFRLWRASNCCFASYQVPIVALSVAAHCLPVYPPCRLWLSALPLIELWPLALPIAVTANCRLVDCCSLSSRLPTIPPVNLLHCRLTPTACCLATYRLLSCHFQPCLLQGCSLATYRLVLPLEALPLARSHDAGQLPFTAFPLVVMLLVY